MTESAKESQSATSPIQNTKITVEDVVDQDELPAAPTTNPSQIDDQGPIMERVEAEAEEGTAAHSGLADNHKTVSEAKQQDKTGSEKEEQQEQSTTHENKPSAPFIRPYDSSRDYDDLLEICVLTIGPSLRTLPSKFHPLVSSIWCKPYLLFCPSTCFVLHDPILDKPVGYIIGTPNTVDFVKTYKDNYLPLVDVQWPDPDSEEGQEMLKELGDFGWLLKEVFNPDKMITEMVVKPSGGPPRTDGKSSDISEDNVLYLAHLHIDILPSHQSKGYGPKLMSAFLEKLKTLSVSGVHVGMDPANDGAGRWYIRMGFKDFKVKGGGRYMVKKLP